MSVPVAALLFVGAFALTVASSIVLARELDRIGERLGFSEALLGIVTALGADAPEIASAVAALVAGHEDTGIGVVVGSNIFNLAALLGVSALIAGSVGIHRHGLFLTGGVAVLVAVVGALVALGVLPGFVGFVLALLFLVPYVVLAALHERTARAAAGSGACSSPGGTARCTTRRVRAAGDRLRRSDRSAGARGCRRRCLRDGRGGAVTWRPVGRLGISSSEHSCSPRSRAFRT